MELSLNTYEIDLDRGVKARDLSVFVCAAAAAAAGLPA